ncbi:MAG: hypothetical protein QM433_05980 [Euryarchaeota archaeon]|nr:hypothetical protein [Euryarchaeota archaeon]
MARLRSWALVYSSPPATGAPPITIDKQLVSVEAGFEYQGGIVPPAARTGRRGS